MFIVGKVFVIGRSVQRLIVPRLTGGAGESYRIILRDQAKNKVRVVLPNFKSMNKVSVRTSKGW